MRTSAIGAAVLAVVLASVLPAQDEGSTSEPPYFEGELAFSEPMAFDYDQDGTPDRVQFWIQFAGQPAKGREGEAGFRPESGAVHYVVADLDRRKKIDNWLMGFNMGFPVAGQPFPITGIVINGRTVSFDLQGKIWTITDRGGSWQEDEFELRDHLGARPGRFFGGDVRVVPDPLSVAEPLDIEANRECNECHPEATVGMTVGGGPHREFECTTCHPEHPPDVEGVVVPACLECHESHSEVMTAASCAECHAGHDFGSVVHRVSMPDSYCASCHGDVADTLRASRSLHMGLKCVLCHQEQHSAQAKGCVFCHRGTHPQHVMESPDRCRDCHNTAHEIARGRDK
jgi:hypothetical protein